MEHISSIAPTTKTWSTNQWICSNHSALDHFFLNRSNKVNTYFEKSLPWSIIKKSREKISIDWTGMFFNSCNFLLVSLIYFIVWAKTKFMFLCIYLWSAMSLCPMWIMPSSLVVPLPFLSPPPPLLPTSSTTLCSFNLHPRKLLFFFLCFSELKSYSFVKYVAKFSFSLWIHYSVRSEVVIDALRGMPRKRIR